MGDFGLHVAGCGAGASTECPAQQAASREADGPAASRQHAALPCGSMPVMLAGQKATGSVMCVTHSAAVCDMQTQQLGAHP